MIISSVFPPPLFSLPLSPSVVVLNKQQGVVGRGLHSRWVFESPAGGDWRGGGVRLPVLSLSLSARGHSRQVG